MTRYVRQNPMHWAVAGAVLTLGLAWRDCILISTSTLLAGQAFRHYMDVGAPWPARRAWLRCVLMGLGDLLCAAALALMVAAAQLGWYQPANDRPLAALLVVLGALACRAAALRGVPTTAGELTPLFAIPILSAIALLASGLGWAKVPCAFALVVGASVAHAGWRLAHRTARELLVAECR